LPSLLFEIVGDELLQDIVGVALFLDALDLKRFPESAVKGGSYFDPHRLSLLFGFGFHKAIRIQVWPVGVKGRAFYADSRDPLRDRNGYTGRCGGWECCPGAIARKPK